MIDEAALSDITFSHNFFILDLDVGTAIIQHTLSYQVFD